MRRSTRSSSEFALRTAAAVDHSLLYREAQASVARAAEEARRREALIGALERSNADPNGFAYAASHDLKAPLRGIASLAEWVEEDLGAQIPDGVRGHLAMLRGRVARLEGLIEGLLAYSGAMLAEAVELLAPPPRATRAARAPAAWRWPLRRPLRE